MQRVLFGFLFVATLCLPASAQTSPPGNSLKSCGIFDSTCVNGNFQELVDRLNAANAKIDALTKRIDDLTARLDDKNTGLDALHQAVTVGLPNQILAVSKVVNGNLSIMSVSRGQCLGFVDVGKGGAGFAGCDPNYTDGVFKLIPR